MLIIYPEVDFVKISTKSKSTNVKVWLTWLWSKTYSMAKNWWISVELFCISNFEKDLNATINYDQKKKP